jgi:hypothetical protein
MRIPPTFTEVELRSCRMRTAPTPGTLSTSELRGALPVLVVGAGVVGCALGVGDPGAGAAAGVGMGAAGGGVLGSTAPGATALSAALGMGMGAVGIAGAPASPGATGIAGAAEGAMGTGMMGIAGTSAAGTVVGTVVAGSDRKSVV